MLILTPRYGSEFWLPKEDKTYQRKTNMKRTDFDYRAWGRFAVEDLTVSKSIFHQDPKKSTFLTECFSDFIKHVEGKGFSNQVGVMPSLTALNMPNHTKYAWMHVVAMPWISQRKRTVKKLETVIWINSFLQYSKHYVALCGYPLVMLSSALLECSKFSWFFRIFHNVSLVIGYLSPCHLLFDKILAWYCKNYVIPAICEDFFRLDMIDRTTYFLYHHKTQLPNVDPTVKQDSENHPEDELQNDVFESRDDHMLQPEYERIKILTELLSNSRKKLNFHSIVRNEENLQRDIVSMRNESGKSLPVVNKSYILNQLNMALRLDFYTCGVLLTPFVLLPTHQMCIFAYSYFILLEHYYHRISLNVSDVLNECKQIIEMEWVNLSIELRKYYNFF